MAEYNWIQLKYNELMRQIENLQHRINFPPEAHDHRLPLTDLLLLIKTREEELEKLKKQLQEHKLTYAEEFI